MKMTTPIALLVYFASLTAAAAADPIVGQHVPPFTAQVMDVSEEEPKTAPYDSATVNSITAYMIMGVSCPATQAYAERMSQLQTLYGPKGVDFIYVYSNREDAIDRKIGFHRERQLGGKLIDDQGGAVAKKLGARRTSEIFLTNKEGTIVYHGGVDDARNPGDVKQHYLQAALDETLTGSPVTMASTPVSA